jgi:DNA-binding CsgD family transcriptional regulator
LWRARALHEIATVEFTRTLRVDGLHQARDAAVEAGAAGLVASIDLHMSAIHGVRFEAAAALAAGRRSVDASVRLGLGGQAAFAWVCVAQAHALTGDRTGCEQAAAHAREQASGAELEAYLWGQCMALLALVGEDRPRARADLARSMVHVRSGEPVSVAPYRALWPLLVTLDGDPAEAEIARAESSTPDVLAHTTCRGLLAYAEAIATGRDDPAAADAAFQRGETEFGRLDPPQGYHQLGRRLAAEAALADGWGEPARWLADAHGYFTDRGLDQLAAAARALLRRAGVPQRRRGRGDTEVPAALARYGITSREADVLRLIAQGLANADIAARLYLAPRTVKTHVEHLLAKTGLSSRVQLATLAAA